MTLVSRQDLDLLEVFVALEYMLEELDLLTVEGDDPDLARIDTGEDEGARDLKEDATREEERRVSRAKKSGEGKERLGKHT